MSKQAGQPKTDDDVAAEIVEELLERDILMGRGKRANTRPGNVMLRQAAEAKSLQYAVLTTKREKRKFARDFIADIERTGARFLEPVTISHEDSYKNVYQEVARDLVEVKIKQLLRDRAAIVFASKGGEKANTTGGLDHPESVRRPSLQLPHASLPTVPRRWSLPSQPVSNMHYTQQLLEEMANADRAELRLQALAATGATGMGFPSAGIEQAALRLSWRQSLLPPVHHQQGILPFPMDQHGNPALFAPISTSARAPGQASGQEENQSSETNTGTRNEAVSMTRHPSLLGTENSHGVSLPASVNGLPGATSWQMLSHLELRRLRQQQMATAMLMGPPPTTAANPAERLLAQQQQPAANAWNNNAQGWTAAARLDPRGSAAAPSSSSSKSVSQNKGRR